MIQAELQKRQAELEQDLKDKEPPAAQAEPRITSRSEPPKPVPTTTPEQDVENFNRLVRTLSTSLERGDEKETRAIFAKMQALQERRPEVIPAPVIEDYAQRVEKLRVHIKQLTDEIVALAERAVLASRNGKEQDLARSMRRLTAIHAAHPRLLDEAGLEDVRREIADAADERREHNLTTKKLLERERAITAEIKVLAAAVHEFHRVASEVSDTAEEFREAEATYLRTIQKVRTYDAGWFSGVVLELADLLAEWSVPPLGAEGQIDRFLDSIDAGLDRIRAEMREIDSEQATDERNGSDAAAQ
jgi:DNA repair exonuclease SbcCD ATPase subunit